MKLIKPSVEILKQEPGVQGIYDMIELCGKTSYKSPVKGGEEAKKFVDARIKDGHNAVLEFGTVYLTITDQRLIDNNVWKVWSSPYTQVNHIGLNNYITTNYRVLVEKDALSALEFLTEPTEFHPKRYCARFITDTGVSHELVRHRKMSLCQESTRYCNYSKDRFGNELTFIIPSWEDLDEQDANIVLALVVAGAKLNDQGERVLPLYKALQTSEIYYFQLLENGFTPQQARQVLPKALKTEICVCGFENDWKHFFDLRCAKNAHPDMQVLAKQLREQFIENKYI